MIRKQLLALTLISICSVAHANLLKDAGRVIGGSAVGAAGWATLQATFNAARAFIEDDATKFPGSDYYKHIRLFGVLGAVYGLAKTTYIRTLRAQWHVWWWRSSKNLLEITMKEHESDEHLIRALERYYATRSYPLVAAKRALAMVLSDVNEAAHLIEKALEDIAEDSDRAQALNDWLDEIYTMRAHVSYAVKVVEQDPRLHAMMDAQNRIDQTNAILVDALGHSAAAITSAHNSK